MSHLSWFRTMVLVLALLATTFGPISPASAHMLGNIQSVGTPDLSISPAFKSYITVSNRSGSTIYVKVSKACGTGQDGYWRIASGASESWSRCVYATVKITVSQSRNNYDTIDWVNHSVKISTVCNYFTFNIRELTPTGTPSRCK